jgi:alkylated DNA repair protein (DNA oxidative demethylase)
MMNIDLFGDSSPIEKWQEQLAPNAVLLHGFAIAAEAELLAALAKVIAEAPFQHMVTPGGFKMSVAMSNCGSVGWVSDRSGYRYTPHNPITGDCWPKMPPVLMALAAEAATAAGFHDFVPDACLINRYEPGAKMSLHQDKDERDFNQPIVSVSLGVPAVFLFGGSKRTDQTCKVPLGHGDIVVWGGADRLRYHGVLPLKECHHASFGKYRINLTFRKAL